MSIFNRKDDEKEYLKTLRIVFNSFNNGSMNTVIFFSELSSYNYSLNIPPDIVKIIHKYCDYIQIYIKHKMVINELNIYLRSQRPYYPDYDEEYSDYINEYDENYNYDDEYYGEDYDDDYCLKYTN